MPLYQDIADEASYVKDWYERNYQNVCDILATGTGGIVVNEVKEERNEPVYTISGVRIPNGTVGAKHTILLKKGKKYVNK